MSNHLQTEFESYIAACEIPNASPDQLKSMRQSFFAGAVVLLAALDSIEKRELVREIERYSAECHEEANLWRRRN